MVASIAQVRHVQSDKTPKIEHSRAYDRKPARLGSRLLFWRQPSESHWDTLAKQVRSVRFAHGSDFSQLAAGLKATNFCLLSGGEQLARGYASPSGEYVCRGLDLYGMSWERISGAKLDNLDQAWSYARGDKAITRCTPGEDLDAYAASLVTRIREEVKLLRKAVAEDPLYLVDYLQKLTLLVMHLRQADEASYQLSAAAMLRVLAAEVETIARTSSIAAERAKIERVKAWQFDALCARPLSDQVGAAATGSLGFDHAPTWGTGSGAQFATNSEENWQRYTNRFDPQRMGNAWQELGQIRSYTLVSSNKKYNRFLEQYLCQLLRAKVDYPQQYSVALERLEGLFADFTLYRNKWTAFFQRAVSAAPTLPFSFAPLRPPVPVLLCSRDPHLDVTDHLYEVSARTPLKLGKEIDLLVAPKCHVQEIANWLSDAQLLGKVQLLSQETFTRAYAWPVQIPRVRRP